MSGYPRNFLWGAATAGHQIEGSNVNADIWLLEQVPETQFREPSGDACDSLNRWREDLGLVRRMGLNAYRFSVEWSRIEPVAGQFSRAWLDHYSAIAAECTACGLAPVITLSHFTSPRWFAAEGGWSNLRAAGQFGRFAGTVAQAVGRDASHIVTFNEPNLPLMGRWATTPLADPVRSGLDAMLAGAAKACGGEAYDVWVYSRGDDARLANLIAGHRAARDAIRAEFPGLPVGMSLALPDVQGVGGDAGVAAYRRFAEDPFFAAARDDDFIGVQNYGRLRVSPSAVVPRPRTPRRRRLGTSSIPRGSDQRLPALTRRPASRCW